MPGLMRRVVTQAVGLRLRLRPLGGFRSWGAGDGPWEEDGWRSAARRRVKVMNGSVRIGSVRGVALRTHWSVPLLMLLFAYGLGSRTLPAYAPGRAAAVYAVAGVAGGLLLPVSLVVHETAHACAARSTTRASARWPSRRSHSPYVRRARVW